MRALDRVIASDQFARRLIESSRLIHSRLDRHWGHVIAVKHMLRSIRHSSLELTDPVQA